MKSGTTIQPIQLVAVVKMMESFALTRRKIMWKKFFFEIFSPKTVWSNNVHMDGDSRDGFH